MNESRYLESIMEPSKKKVKASTSTNQDSQIDLLREKIHSLKEDCHFDETINEDVTIIASLPAVIHDGHKWLNNVWGDIMGIGVAAIEKYEFQLDDSTGDIMSALRHKLTNMNDGWEWDAFYDTNTFQCVYAPPCNDEECDSFRDLHLAEIFKTTLDKEVDTDDFPVNKEFQHWYRQVGNGNYPKSIADVLTTLYSIQEERDYSSSLEKLPADIQLKIYDSLLALHSHQRQRRINLLKGKICTFKEDDIDFCHSLHTTKSFPDVIRDRKRSMRRRSQSLWI